MKKQAHYSIKELVEIVDFKLTNSFQLEQVKIKFNSGRTEWVKPETLDLKPSFSSKEQVYQDKIQEYIKNGSKGNLDLSNTPITSLPENLKVGRSLDLRNTPITSLPDNLTVGGFLDLSNTKITSLPDNLTVGDSLYLDNTPITSLPDNLTVGDSLYLRNTPITSLPKNLKIGGNLYLENTPLSKQYTKEQVKQMVPGVKGYIYF